MTVLRHTLLAATAATITLAAFQPATLRAQDPPPAPGTVHEQLQALRQLVEQQSKQIQVLSDQIARLTVQIETRAAAAPPAVARPGEFAVPVARPAAPAQPPPPPANVHIMVKGDSLDKIARTYDTTVAELLKLNKITDPKKLQIGQQIVLPPNATPAAPAASGQPAPAKPGEQ